LFKGLGCISSSYWLIDQKLRPVENTEKEEKTKGSCGLLVKDNTTNQKVEFGGLMLWYWVLL
jgi:hypothetical protein